MPDLITPVITVLEMTASWFLNWRKKKKELSESERLRQCLEIRRVTQRNEGNRHWRVKVHNTCGVTVRFKATLESIEPRKRGEGDHLATPAPLQLGYTEPPYEEADIPADGDGLVNVFVDMPEQNKIGFLVIGGQGQPVLMDREEYQISVCAFPISPPGVSPKRHSFFIKPQKDGTMIFSDAGDGVQIMKEGSKPSS